VGDKRRHPPVLDAGAGLHGLELGGDAPHASFGHRVDVHQRRVSDQLHTHRKQREKISFSSQPPIKSGTARRESRGGGGDGLAHLGDVPGDGRR
jgi:hypothetical protein